MAVFAGLTMIGLAFGSLSSAVVGVILGVLAWNELRGGAMLRRFDPSGARVLGRNQIFLGIGIIVYGAWSLRANLGSLGSLQSIGTTGDPSVDAMVNNISQVVTVAVYGGVILLGIVVPGLTALYYFSRGKLVRSFVESTPPWVVETLRAAG